MKSEGNIHTREAGRRQLGYTVEFKEMLKDHPKAMHHVIEMVKDFEEDFTRRSDEDSEPLLPKEKEGVVVRFLSSGGEGRQHYQVAVGHHVFFLKTTDTILLYEAGLETQNGYEEFSSAQRAREILASLPDVEIVEYHLGYSSDTQKFVLSKWYDNLTLLSDSPARRASLQDRVEEIQTLLLDAGFEDVEDYNMAYDEKKKKIILFDLNWYTE